MSHMITTSCAYIRQLCQYIYIPYEFTAINNVTRSTGIHIFQITGICPWTNMPATLHVFVLLQFYCSLYTGNNNLLYYCKICSSNKYAIQMSNKGHMPKLLNVHQWEKHASIYATYLFTGNNHVIMIVVHRWQHRMMMMVQILSSPLGKINQNIL